jgi:hypothetical protein
MTSNPNTDFDVAFAGARSSVRKTRGLNRRVTIARDQKPAAGPQLRFTLMSKFKFKLMGGAH